eukprot:TRINITY_DN352_c0_g2_i1.p1 TRINITY_DN352_c0_g2~~TRINITY_DN352_c0_g2_i1.p1  ORF type:complete len:598 (+),score=102.41 TRINITY_DN352_c0_g2_i1:117-1796(+)
MHSNKPVPSSTVVARPHQFKLPTNPRIGIIGSGWTGLYALKTFLEEKLTNIIVFERTEEVGGVWVYREDVPGGCFQKTRTTASKSYLHASDFPFPEDTSCHFPHHKEVLKFLQDYADHFKLHPYIQTKTHVEQAYKDKETNKWVVVTYEGAAVREDPLTVGTKKIHEFDILVCASGQHQNPFVPMETVPWKDYKGEYSHAHNYKHVTPDMADKSMCIVGGGESASDVAAEVCETSDDTYMSIRSGVWFQDRTVGAWQPADMVFTKHQRLWGFTDYHSWLIFLGRYIMLELMWGKGGSGVDVWQPHCQYFHGFLNKSRDTVDKVALGKIKPRGAAVKCEGKKVWFAGRSEPDNIDHVIFCTGYRSNHPFMRDGQTDTHAYKYVFDTRDPTLCFLGTVRPMIGSIPALAELQARWAAKIYTGQYTIPCCEDMAEIVIADKVKHKRVFPQDDYSLPQLVNHWYYSDEIAELFDAKPKLVQWFFRNPFTWWKIISAPWSAFLYRVEDPKTRDEALKNIEVHTWLPSHFSFHAMNNVILFMDLCVVLMVLGFVYYIFTLITSLF